NDFSVWFLEDGEGLSGAVGYNVDIIDAEGAHAICDRFGSLLQSLGAQPQQAIGDASLLSASDRDRLGEWNSTVRPLPPQRSTFSLLVQQAARTPQRVALPREAQRLTYAQQHARAGPIAGALHARGVPPGDRLGICLQRGPYLVAAMIAAW